jgi:hypothetical protein
MDIAPRSICTESHDGEPKERLKMAPFFREKPPLHPKKTGFYLGMNANAKLGKIRDLARSRMLEVPSFAGEEMNLPNTDPRRDGFIDGERTLAAQILALVDEKEADSPEKTGEEAFEEAMVEAK